MPLLPSVHLQYNYNSTPHSTCTVQLYLYSLYSPHGLYTASVPVLYSYTCTPPMGRTAFTEPQCLYSTSIPLLPSVTVQYSYTTTPLSTCTVQLYLYSPQYLYSTAIPLLPSVPVQYSYTSTPHMDRTACTEAHCLYKSSLYLYLYQFMSSPAIRKALHFPSH